VCVCVCVCDVVVQQNVQRRPAHMTTVRHRRLTPLVDECAQRGLAGSQQPASPASSFAGRYRRECASSGSSVLFNPPSVRWRLSGRGGRGGRGQSRQAVPAQLKPHLENLGHRMERLVEELAEVVCVVALVGFQLNPPGPLTGDYSVRSSVIHRASAICKLVLPLYLYLALVNKNKTNAFCKKCFTFVLYYLLVSSTLQR
jgi:hypothetical protein